MATKNTRIDLGNNYSVEVKETLPDSKGNRFEGFLYYKRTFINDVAYTGLYPTPEALVVDYKENILPDYLRGNKDHKINTLNTKDGIYEFVKKYLVGSKLTWGSTVDVIEILAASGYHLPKIEDGEFDFAEYSAYKVVVPKISLEMTKQLKSFGFDADRNSRNTKNHPVKETKKGWYNVVYTRYPWTPGYKLIKTLNTFIAASGGSFVVGKDLTSFKKNDAVGYEMLKLMVESMKDMHIATKQSSLDTGLERAIIDFKDYIDENENELVATYSKKRPVKYGKYDN